MAIKKEIEQTPQQPALPNTQKQESRPFDNNNAKRVQQEWLEKNKAAVEAERAEEEAIKEKVLDPEVAQATEAAKRIALEAGEKLLDAVLNKKKVNVEELFAGNSKDDDTKTDKPGEAASQEASTDESVLADAEALGVSLEEASKLAPETRKTLIASLGKKESQAEQVPQFKEVELDDLAGTLDAETMAKVKGLVNATAKDAFEKDQQIKKLQSQIEKAAIASEEQALDSFVNGLAAEKEWEEIFGKGQGAKLKVIAPDKFKARTELWNEMQKQKVLGVEPKEALRRAFNIHYSDKVFEIKSAKDRARAADRAKMVIGKPTPRSSEAASSDSGTKEGKQQSLLDKAGALLNKIRGK